MTLYTIRTLEDEDCDWLFHLHNDPNVLKQLTNDEPVDKSNHLIWFDEVKYLPIPHLIFEVDNQRVGLIKYYNLDDPNHVVHCGADIHKDFRGKGYAKFMWKLLLDNLFYNYDTHKAALYTLGSNKIAQKVYAGLGFRIEGKQLAEIWRGDQWHDMLYMGLFEPNWRDIRGKIK